MINRYLEDLERRIQPDMEEELLMQWKQFIDGAWPEEIFAPRHRQRMPASIEWPEIHINDALEDFVLMAFNQE